MKARTLRALRRRSQRRSQNRNGMGVSELFLASKADATMILAAEDARLKQYLLGFDRILMRASWTTSADNCSPPVAA